MREGRGFSTDRCRMYVSEKGFTLNGKEKQGGVTVGKEFPYVMIPPCIIRDKEFFLVH